MKKTFQAILLIVALLTTSLTAHAATGGALLFSVDLTSNPPATPIPMGEDKLTARVGDTIVFTRHIQESGVINNAWQWNFDPSKLDCGATPDFDSPDFKCLVRASGNSAVSITMYPIMADHTRRIITSNLIYVMVEGGNGSTENSLPEIYIKDVNFYQKFNGKDNVIVFDLCNTGNATYEEKTYGTLSLNVSMGGKSDGFAFSGNINSGECKSFDREGLLSSFYNFFTLINGYYTMDVSLVNKIDGKTAKPLSKKIYFIGSTTAVAPLLKNTTSATSAPAAGYEDEVVVNQEAYTNPFPDTDIKKLEGIAASELYRRAVLGGYPGGEFRGSRDVNRAEAAKFLLLARYGYIADFKNNKTFPDVKDGEWYVKFVISASLKGIINGYPDGFFRPQDKVRTEEFMKMLVLTFGIEEDLPYTYSDVKSSDWFAKYAGAAQKYQLFPDRETRLNPGTYLTRKEVAIAIYQYLSHR